MIKLNIKYRDRIPVPSSICDINIGYKRSDSMIWINGNTSAQKIVPMIKKAFSIKPFPHNLKKLNVL